MAFSSSVFEPTFLIWCIGKYFIAACIMFLIGKCLHFSFVDDPSSDPKATKSPSVWPVQIFCYLLSSFLLLSIAVICCSSSPVVAKIIRYFPAHLVLFCLGIFCAASVGLKNASDDGDFKCGQTLLWFVQSVIMAPCFSFFCKDVLIKAGAATVSIVLLAKTLATSCFDEIQERERAIVLWIYLALCTTALFQLTVRPPLNVWTTCILAVNVFGGCLLFFAVFLINFQSAIREIDHNGEVDELHTASKLFVASLNLCFRLAHYYAIEDSGLL